MSQTTAWVPESPAAPSRSFFSVSNALRLGFGAWLRHLAPLTLLALIVYAPLFLWTLSVTDRPWSAAQFQHWALRKELISQILDALLAGMVVTAVAARHDGKRLPLGQLLASMARRFLPALVVAVMVGTLIGVGMMLFWIPGLVAMSCFFVATPAVVSERPGVFGALARSVRLTRGCRVAIVGLLAVRWVVLFAVAVVAAMVISSAMDLDGGPGERMMACSLGIEAVMAPLKASLAAAAYVLLRRERDGVDTATLEGVFE